MDSEDVILVDSTDRATGTMEKMEAHRKGALHRAFSVFVFNPEGKLLLQQRALDKYHSAGLWTNTCCSHPRPDEDTSKAAARRLKEEMGLETELRYKTSFLYRAEFDNGLTEHEFDHVYTGITPNEPVINRAEAADYKWLWPEDIKSAIAAAPDNFTPWFRIAMEKFF